MKPNPMPEKSLARSRRPDARPAIAAGGAMVRVRAHGTEYHKTAAVGARRIPGGLVAKRRVGK